MKNVVLLLGFVAVLVGGGVFAMQAMLPKGHDCPHCKANQSKCCTTKPHALPTTEPAKPAL